MRRVGRQVGVEAMSLYHHVAGKEDLLDAIQEVLAARTDEPAGADAGWEQLLRDYARATRATALAHPRTYPLVAHRRLRTPLVLRRANRLLGAFRAAGLSDADAVSAMRLWGGYVIGYLLDELALEPGQGARWDPADAGPLDHLVAVAPYLGLDHVGAHFERGVELIIAGVRGSAA
jgi:AcrR family transcriptional regulator